MQPQKITERMIMLDLIGKINITGVDLSYFLRNNVPEMGMMLGLNIEHQSRAASLNAESHELRGLLKIQEWAQHHGGFEKTGWLTPGVDGPGLVDVALAPYQKFYTLIYGVDMFKDERLKPLASWYARFTKLPWWKEFEEREDIIPPMLSFGQHSRAAWADGTDVN
jgi:hypothetical protein